jgi:hypothetical protein
VDENKKSVENNRIHKKVSEGERKKGSLEYMHWRTPHMFKGVCVLGDALYIERFYVGDIRYFTC